MDLRVTCQASAELLSRTAAQTAPEASVQAPAFGAARTDRAELSTGRPARDSEAERLHALAQAQKQAELVRQQAREEAERARETAEAMAEWLDARLKCLKIASRIMSGDRVPPEDSRFLLENDPKLYQMAVTGRLPKEDPKEHKSVLDEEDLGGPESADAQTQSASEPAASDRSDTAAPEDAQPAQ